MKTPLEIAISQLGVKESTGANDGTPSERYMGGRREPWCAHFVAWCFREAGRPLAGDRPASAGAGGENPIASVAEMERRMLRAGHLYVMDPDVVDDAGAGMVPEPGDIIFFADRTGSDTHAGGRHVGIVEHVGTGETSRVVHTIEGNIANQVARRVHLLSDPRITGFGVAP